MKSVQFCEKGGLCLLIIVLFLPSQKDETKEANRRRSAASVLCHRSFPRAQNSLLDIRIVLHYGSDLNVLIHDLLPTPLCLCRKTQANHIKM